MNKKNFYWSGINVENKKIKGQIAAASLNLAKIQLHHQNIKIISIQRKINIFGDYFTKKISLLDIAIFFRQLATLIKAGIPLVQSFEILYHAEEKASLQQLLQAVKVEIESGKSLVTCLQQFPTYFDPLSCHLIKAGEYGGTLEKILQRIANHKEQSLLIKNQIRQALFYPVFIFSVACLICLFMLLFIVPRFEELFSTMHANLPPFTLLILNLSKFLRIHIVAICMLGIGGGLLIYFLKLYIWLRAKLNSYLLTIPIIGNYIKKVALIRFTRNLAIMLAASVPISDALPLLAPICGNIKYLKAVQYVHAQIIFGQTMHQSMQGSPLFTPLTIQMIRVGEEAGNLDTMLDKIAEIYEADVTRFIANFCQLLEPLIMIILGVLIGGLIIAMYLPIFKLGTLV